jgi:Uncharacterized conserved protein (DUF2163)
MRKILSGAGVDTTATVMSWLQANKEIILANLYLIGEPDDPQAVWLTDWESSLIWSLWGQFNSTVIKRGTITSKIGLDSDALDLTWSPKNTALTSSIQTASPYQLARLGWFDNKRVRVWRCYMPTPGDANTFGAMELFAGFIGDATPERGLITFSVNNYLYLLNQKVPTGIIEVTNTLASYSGGSPPSGFSVIPQFNVVAGSTDTVLIADQISPNAGSIPGTDSLDGAYLVFNGGPGMTLQGQYSIIGRNTTVNISGTNHAQFQLYSPLPWAPTPGVDTFYICGQSPINQADGDYYGFPYVPAPETAA